MKKKYVRLLTALVAVLLAFTMSVPAFGAQMAERIADAPVADVMIDDIAVPLERVLETISSDMTVSQFIEEIELEASMEASAQLGHVALQALLTPAADHFGIIGFEGAYAINHRSEIVEIAVQFMVPPAVALYHMAARGMANFARLGETFADQALSAHYAFDAEMAGIGIDVADVAFNRNHTLFNGAFLRVPAYMLDAIADLPSVMAIYPNARFDEPYAPIFGEETHEMRNATIAGTPNFPVDFMRGTRDVLDTEYVNNVMGYTGYGVTIAVIDSGLRHDHAVFAHLLEAGQYEFFGWCFLTNTPNTWEGAGTGGPTSNHGTGVAASAIAVAPMAQIMPLRVFGPWPGSGAWDIIVQAVEFAHYHEVEVMNLSLGMATPNDTNRNIFTDWFGPTHIALALAALDGIAVTQAGGNAFGGITGYTITAPAMLTTSLVVGGSTLGNHTTGHAISTIDNVDVESSRGPVAITGHIRPDFLAPYRIFGAGTANPNSYVFTGGTSFSAPIGAGIVALMLEANPGMCPFEVRARIMNTSIRPANLTVANISAHATGAGRARAIEALNTTSWAVTYSEAPMGYDAGYHRWHDDPVQMGSINFGFVEAQVSAPIRIYVYDTPSNAGWTLNWEVYHSNIFATNIPNLDGVELIVNQIDEVTFDVQIAFTAPATLNQMFSGFVYLTYVGDPELVLTMPWAGRKNWVEPHFSSFVGTPPVMNLFGGNWTATTTGFFEVPHDFVVYRDGVQWATGTLAGTAFSRSVVLPIPANETGIDQIYVMHIPILEGTPGYAPITLLVEGHDPGFAQIIAIDSTNNPAAINTFALDSTLSVIDRWMGGDTIHSFDDFTDHIPNAEDFDDMWDSRWTTQATGVVLAGTYDMFWWRWAPGISVPFWTTHTFTQNTYIVELIAHTAGHGTADYRIIQMPTDSVIDEFFGNRATVPVIGGNWTATVAGVFLPAVLTAGSIEYVIELDGAYFASGVMTGNMLRQSVTVAIPANHSGVDREFVMHLPALENLPGYAPLAVLQGGVHPGYANVTIINDTGVVGLHMLAFDLSMEAINIWEGGGTINILDTFDQHVPHIENEAIWDAFRTPYQGSNNIMAGYYDIFWWSWSPGIQIPFFLNMEFQAGNNYVIVLHTLGAGHGNGTFTIHVDPGLELFEFGVNRNTMNMLAGNIELAAVGLFIGEPAFAFEVYLDGVYYMSGMMSGNHDARRAAIIPISQNNTGVSREFEVRVPALDGVPGYAPQFITQSGDPIGVARVSFSIGNPWGDNSGYVMLLDSQNRPPINDFGNYDIFMPANAATPGSVIPVNSTYSVIIPEGMYSIHTANVLGAGLPWTWDVVRWVNFEITPGYHYHFFRFATGAGNIWYTRTPMRQVFFEAYDNYGGEVTATFTLPVPVPPVHGNQNHAPGLVDVPINSGDWVPLGSNVTFTATPWQWYVVGDWDVEFAFPFAPQVPGEPVEITLNNIQFDTHVVVEFFPSDPFLYEIELDPAFVEIGQGNTFTFGYIMTDQHGNTYVPLAPHTLAWSVTYVTGVTINPVTGLITVGPNVPVGATFDVTVEATSGNYTETATAQAEVILGELYVYFESDPITGGNITATANGAPINSGDTVARGATVVFTVVTNPGYRLIGWNLGPAPLGNNVSEMFTFTITNLQASVKAVAIFEEIPVIVITPDIDEVTQGFEFDFAAMVFDMFGFPTANVVTWTVTIDHYDVFTGDRDGVILYIDDNDISLYVERRLSAGSVITLEAYYDGDYAYLELTVLPHVWPEVVEIVYDPADLEIIRGQSATFAANIFDQFGIAYAGTVAWSIVPPIAGVEVSAAGVVTVANFVPLDTTFVLRAEYAKYIGGVYQYTIYDEVTIAVMPNIFTITFGHGTFGGEIVVFHYEGNDYLTSWDEVNEGDRIYVTFTVLPGYIMGNFIIEHHVFGGGSGAVAFARVVPQFSITTSFIVMTDMNFDMVNIPIPTNSIANPVEIAPDLRVPTPDTVDAITR